MPSIYFKNEGVKVALEHGKTLADIFRKNGISLEMPCNGRGTCGKCLVTVIPDGKEPKGGETERVLACQYRTDESQGDLTVETVREDALLVSVNHGKSVEISADFDIRVEDAGSLVFGSQEPYVNRLNVKNVSVSVLNKIAAIEKEKYAAALYAIFYIDRLLDIVKGARPPVPLGLAVDLGTTGVSVALMSMETGKILENESFLNPQFEYGGDVLTRTSYCMEDAGNTRKLQKLVIDKLNTIIAAFSDKGHDPAMIYRVTVAGNTVMQHIFAGVEPSLLAKNPYRPIFNEALDLSLHELHINPNAVITILPAISSYVGGDIVAGIVSTGFHLEKRNALFIDIGTNGEIALIINGGLWCTSTAAGPALEGMNISCGQRAVAGAIDSFFSDEKGGISFSTIGGAEPTGICGSGLIDLTAVLLKKGFIDSFGRLSGKKYDVTEKITLLQKDVRQIQLAKGAIASGIKMLIDEAGGRYDAIDAVYIAGSFGYHLNAENLKEIGIISRSFKGEIIFVGNSSLEGAEMALKNKNILSLMSEIRKKVRPVELSHRDKFQSVFVKELRFG